MLPILFSEGDLLALTRIYWSVRFMLHFLPGFSFARLLVIIFCWLSSLPFVGAQTTVNRHYAVENGLPSNRVYCVRQDSKGFLWFSTDRGVCRYNGQSFTRYSVADGLTDNEVLQVHEDQKGRIWFQTFNGIPCYFFEGEIHHPGNTPFLKEIAPKGFLSAFLNAPDGSVYLGYFEGYLYRIDRDQRVELVVDGSNIMEAKSVTALWVDRNQVFAGSSLSAVRNVTKGKVIQPLKVFRKGLGPPRMFWLNESLYIASGRDMYVFDRDFQLVMADTLPDGENVTYLGMGFRSNELAVGTTKGLRFLQQGSNRFSEDILPGKTVTFICRDHENGLWITTHDNGVYYAQSQAILHYNQEVLTDFPVHSVFQHRDTVWVGSSNFNLSAIVEDTLAVSRKVKPNKLHKGPGRIEAIFNIKDEVWLRTDRRLSNSFGKYTLDPEINRAYGGYDLETEPSGKMWLSTGKGIAPLRFRAEDWLEGDEERAGRRYRLNSTAQVITYDARDSSLLCGTAKGIVQIDLGSGESRALYPEIDGKRPSGILLLDNDRTLVTTLGWGCFLFEGDSLAVHLNQKKGFYPSNINKLRVDASGHIWMASNSGLYLIPNPEDPWIDWEWKCVNYANGLLSDIVHDLTFYKDRVYVASYYGVSALDTTLFLSNRQPPIMAGMEVVQNLFADRPVTLVVDAISFADKNLRFRFSIDDGPWVESASNAFNLLGLEPGTYTIKAGVKSGFSDWSESQLQEVTVPELKSASTWWQWTVGGLGGLVLLLAFRMGILELHFGKLKKMGRSWRKRLQGPLVLTLKTSTESVKMPIHQILWIKSEANYCSVVTAERKILVLATLKSFEDQLEEEGNFMRVHRSFIVNLKQVTGVKRTEVRIGDTYIPVGTTYQAAYLQFYKAYSDELVE